MALARLSRGRLQRRLVARRQPESDRGAGEAGGCSVAVAGGGREGPSYVLPQWEAERQGECESWGTEWGGGGWGRRGVGEDLDS